MKTIVAGSRTIDRHGLVRAAIVVSGWADQITEIVSGTARGVDQIGEQWAKEKRLPIKRFPAEWDRYGKRAGYLRNEAMAQYADALIAVWDGKSDGTKHMIDLAHRYGLQVFVFQSNMQTDETDYVGFDTPRRFTARIPIFCELCRKQGRVAYRKGDDPRYGGGHYSGPTMRLSAYLAGSPKVCSQCDKSTMERIGVFD